MVATGESERRRAGVGRLSGGPRSWLLPRWGERRNIAPFGADFAGALARTGDALPLIRIGSGFVALALFAGAPAVPIGDAPSLYRGCDGASGLAAGDRRISPQAERIRASARGVRRGGGAYWAPFSEKRKGRNAKRRERQTITLDDYVLTQPPVYTGPKRPVNRKPEEEKAAERAQDDPGRRRFLRPPRDFQFVPQRPSSESSSSAPMPVTRLHGTDPRTGGADLFVRDRRHRQPRHESGLSASRPGSRASRPRSATTSCSPPTASN